jgi:hypothetical protein
MHAAALRKQPDGWDIPTLEDDAQTRVYFHPSGEPSLLPLPALDALPPVRMSMPIQVAPVAPVIRLVPPPAAPVHVQPRPRPAPPIEAQHTARVRRQSIDSHRTAVYTLSAACMVAALMIAGAIVLRGSHASHAAASVVTAPSPAITAAPIVTPIEPAPVDHRNVVIVSETPAPQPVQAAPQVHHATHHAVVAAATGTGTLELSTKPPCEIVIDGRSTGFTTPRKGISVPAGRHRVTLENAAAGIRLTTELIVTAGHATRMIRDFTK